MFGLVLGRQVGVGVGAAWPARVVCGGRRDLDLPGEGERGSAGLFSVVIHSMGARGLLQRGFDFQEFLVDEVLIRHGLHTPRHHIANPNPNEIAVHARKSPPLNYGDTAHVLSQVRGALLGRSEQGTSAAFRIDLDPAAGSHGARPNGATHAQTHRILLRAPPGRMDRMLFDREHHSRTRVSVHLARGAL